MASPNYDKWTRLPEEMKKRKDGIDDSTHVLTKEYDALLAKIKAKANFNDNDF
jgi:hypothetical protein